MATYYANINTAYQTLSPAGRVGTRANPFTVLDVFEDLLDGVAVNGVSLSDDDIVRLDGIYASDVNILTSDLVVNNVLITSWEDREPWKMIGSWGPTGEGPYSTGTLRISILTNPNMSITIEDGFLDTGIVYLPSQNGFVGNVRNVMGGATLSLGIGISGTLNCDAVFAKNQISTTTGPGAPQSFINVTDSVFYGTQGIVSTSTFSNCLITHLSNYTNLSQAVFEANLAGTVVQNGEGSNSYSYPFSNVPPTQVSINNDSQVSLDDLSYPNFGLPIVESAPTRWANGDYNASWLNKVRYGYGAFYFPFDVAINADPSFGKAPLNVQYNPDVTPGVLI